MSWLECLHIKSFQFWCIRLCKPPLTTVLYEVENLQQHTQCSVILKHPTSSLVNTRNVWENYHKPSSG